MKELYLTNSNHAVTVSDETYAEIMAIVNRGQVCQQCQQVYTEENPQVAQNTCLTCFLRREAGEKFTFVGKQVIPSSVDDGTYYTHFQFLNDEGYIYRTSTSGNETERDIYRTLGYWGFILPTTYDHNGQTERIYYYRVSIYGNIRNSNALVIEYVPYSYDGGKPAAFLIYKDDVPLQLNKRKGDIRKRFADAMARVEATKDTKGGYHLAGHDYTVYQVYDSTLYPFIVEAENAKLQATK